jgi:geranylgeranyl reductase family protein
MIHYDVAIVGGGPVGGYIAKEIAQHNYSVLVLEEHPKIGLPLKCAGLVSNRVLSFIGTAKQDIVQNKITGAHLYSPQGETLSIGGKKIQAYVINRQRFDTLFIELAKKHGAEIKLNNKVISATRTKQKITLDHSNKKETNTLSCSLLIGADGTFSTIRKTFQLPPPAEILYSIGAEVKNITLDPNYVHIHLGEQIAPGFFSWIIPINKNGTKARIGLCVKKTAKTRLKHCFEHLLDTPQLRDAQIITHIGGTIPLGPIKNCITSRVMIVGDAAAQVKPTSGGGLFPGLVCAHHCANTAITALKNHQYDKETLKIYQKKWLNEIGRELSLGMKFRRLYREFDDRHLEKYFNKLNTEKNLEIIERLGDIDYPSQLAIPLLKANPSLLKILPAAFKIKQRKNRYYEPGGGGT